MYEALQIINEAWLVVTRHSSGKFQLTPEGVYNVMNDAMSEVRTALEKAQGNK
jgi:hypothetical protein